MFITRIGIKALEGGKTLLKTLTRAKGLIKGAAIKPLEKDTIEIAGRRVAKPTVVNEPFCEQFWRSQNLRLFKRPYHSVSYHDYLHGINHHLTTHTDPEGLNQLFMQTGITPKEMIILTDAEFKALPKTTETIRSFRCIGEKPAFFEKEYARYTKSLEIKKGEIIRMPEYAYSSIDINFAKNFLYGTNGIIYDIEIPVGSRVSISGCDIVFPRSSRFECLGKEVKDGVTTIKIRYIQPIDYMG